MNLIPLTKTIVVATSITAAVASSALGDHMPSQSRPDQAWATVQPSQEAAATGPQTRRQMADRFKSTADDAKAFREKYPNDPKAAEAERIEAHALLDAAMAGDASEATRVAALLAKIRRDSRMSAKERLEVVAHAEHAGLQPFTGDLKKWREAQQESARRLIAEFPQEAGGYEALLQAAENQPDEAKGAAMARELMASPAPATVKAVAQALLDRQALAGQSLPLLAHAVPGAESAIGAAKGRRLVVYTWASWSPGAIAHAKRLPKLLPADVVVIGINVDRDVAAARTQAEREGLPGEQLYDEHGLEGSLAQALKVSPAMPAYVVGSGGEIRGIFPLRDDISEKLGLALR